MSGDAGEEGGVRPARVPLPVPELGAPPVPPAPLPLTGGGAPSGVEASPVLPVPAGGPGVPEPVAGGPVTDDDRHRYGRLLDSAHERGLLGERDYELRLGELAAAASIGELNRIVTELPVFTPTVRARPARRSPRSPRRPRPTPPAPLRPPVGLPAGSATAVTAGSGAVGTGSAGPGTTESSDGPLPPEVAALLAAASARPPADRRSSPWVRLAVLVVAVVVALAVLAAYGEHLARTRSPAAPPGVTTGLVAVAETGVASRASPGTMPGVQPPSSL